MYFPFVSSCDLRLSLLFRHAETLVAAQRLPVLSLAGLAAIVNQLASRARIMIASNTTVSALKSSCLVIYFLGRFHDQFSVLFFKNVIEPILELSTPSFCKCGTADGHFDLPSDLNAGRETRSPAHVATLWDPARDLA